LLALCRWRRPSRRLLALLAVALVAADLWHYGHGLLRTLPAAVYETPSPLAAALLPARDRIFIEESVYGGLVVVPRGGDPRTIVHRTYVSRLSPYAALLWQIPYAFNKDFDLMLTGWGRKAEDVLKGEPRSPEAFYRYLGVWNVGTLLLARTSPDQPPAAAGPEVQGMRKVRNGFVLPRFRFVPRVTFRPSQDAALAAARASGWDVGREEQSVWPGRPPRTLIYRRPPRLLTTADTADEGGRIRFDYQADEGAFFVAAMTFDKGWRAQVDGSPVAVHPTAACQLGVQLPPGAHRLELRYVDPAVPLGAAVSLAALLAGAILFRRRQFPMERT
ncbi:MAG: YfhO family protein, partial [Thermoanaerobaculia bacterium]